MDEPSVARGRVSAPELEMQVVLERERAAGNGREKTGIEPSSTSMMESQTEFLKNYYFKLR